MENEIDLVYLWNILLKRKLLIVSITIVSTLLSVIYGLFIKKPEYDACVSIIIGKEEARYFLEDRYTSGDISLYLQVAKTYEEIARSKIVYKRTKDHVQDKDFDLLKNIKVVSKAGTQILTMSVTHPSPEKVIVFANSLAESFIQVAGEMLPAGELRILDKAERPISDSSDRKMKILIGFFLGFIVSMGTVMFMEFINRSIECEEDIKEHLNLLVLAVIPNQSNI